MTRKPLVLTPPPRSRHSPRPRPRRNSPFVSRSRRLQPCSLPPVPRDGKTAPSAGRSENLIIHNDASPWLTQGDLFFGIMSGASERAGACHDPESHDSLYTTAFPERTLLRADESASITGAIVQHFRR